MKRRTKIKERSNGITLIALVITIIVLLILAGISIATLTGENGILTKATKSKEETQKATAEEKVQLEVLGSYDTNGELNTDLLTVNLGNIEGLTYNGKTLDKDTNSITSLPAIVVVDSVEIKIKVNGSVSEVKPMPLVTEAPTTAKVEENTQYQDAESENKIAIIPAGFAVVPGCTKIDDGLVISDVANDKEDTGNQFVWISVTSESEYVRNTTYENTGTSATAYTDTGYLPEGIQPKTDEGSSNEEAEKQAVLNAGGFYISRYEAGDEFAEYRTSDTDGILVSKKNRYAYTSISQENSKVKAKTFIDNENVKSALISGIQWDVTMATINGKKDGNGETYDVTMASSGRHMYNSQKTTGQNIADKVYNIYDLEANCWEYTAEKTTKDNSYPIVHRAGCFFTTNYSASHRNGGRGTTQMETSFRLVLYVI